MTWSLSEIQPSKRIENRSRYLICGQPARFMQLKLVHQLNQLCLLTQDPFNFSPLYCTTQFVDLQLHLSGSHKKKKKFGNSSYQRLKATHRQRRKANSLLPYLSPLSPTLD